jgi:ABC-2 type transport system permease protein
MLDRVRATLQLYGALFAQMLKVRLAYKGDFLADLAATGLGGVASLIFVLLLFHRVESLGGFSRHEVLLIYGFSMVSYGLFGTISWNLYEFGDRYVIQGRFDRVLLRPASSYLQVLFDSFRIPALSESVIGAGVIAFAARRLGLRPDALDLALGLLSVLSGAVIFTAVFSLIAALSFRFEDRIGIAPPVFNLIAFSRYPQDLFPAALRFLLRWVIPFGFVAFYPALGILGRAPHRGLTVAAPLVALAFTALAGLVWRAGVRRYASTGS